MMSKYMYVTKTEHAPVCIYSKTKPSEKRIPFNGTWRIDEFSDGKWQMPCTAEITWGTIQKNLIFVGKIKDTELKIIIKESGF